MVRPLSCLFAIYVLSCGLAAGQCSPCTIWNSNTTPTIADSGDTSSVELGVKFRADSTGFVTGVRFYKSAANGGTHIGNLWSSSGVLLASAQFTGESASGWQQVSFGTPVSISSGTTYIASYFAPQSHYAFDVNFFATSGVDNPPLHALVSGVDGSNGVYNYGSSSSFPGSSYNSSNYWVDVVFVLQGATTTPPTIISVAPVNASSGVPVVAGPSASFSNAMDPTSFTTNSFQLFDSNNNPVAGTVSYSAATITATFQPNAVLASQTTYTAVVRGTVTDFFGNGMGSDFSWSFTTESPSTAKICPCTIWPSTAVPSLADGADPSAIEVGLKFRADVSGYVTSVRFYKAAANTGTHIGHLWTASGTLLGSVVFTGESASGWQQATFSPPIALIGGTTYVASYFTSSGHYSWDEYQLANEVDNAPLHALSGSSIGNGLYTTSNSSAFPTTSYNASGYGVDVVYVLRNSTTPPAIVSTAPGNGATGVALSGTFSVQFNEPMDPATITSSAFQLVDSSNNVVPGTVSYVPSNASLTFQPTLSLSPQTVYTATVYSSAHDAFGNPLAGDYSGSFTTAPPPGDSGPGGPILVIASSVNPFSRYLGEILLNEGLNEFLVKDITTVTPTVLSQYDIAILGDFALSGAQASMLNTWVTSGGCLIAMHPDQQLAGMLGLTPTGATLSEGYMLVNTQTAPGNGIYGQSMQFHGTADLYTLNGAAALATLFTTPSTPTSSPALTLANAGVGQAAAFTYDLARSVVFTRQGNPAWSGEDRDGYLDPAYDLTEIRSNDLFYGNASFDPETDWVNLNTVQVPQADEQQRLFTNLIQMMNARRKPLPRFWYLPNGYKAAVIMTGDDHGGNGTQPRFDTYVAESPKNCSVADWTCVRATSYIWPVNVTFNPPTSYTSYIAEGFEIANHADNAPTCSTFTPASLDASITAELGLMTQFFPLAPGSQTNRTHCVLWSDYDSTPGILFNHGIRLDTSYYYWPDPWVQDRPGLFTGSGLPMRYADRNGNTFDVYQATTQFPDETTWNMPDDVNVVLENAVGPLGFYAVLTANMHTDHIQEQESDGIVGAAQAYGAPVIAAKQMLTWLDGRNNSTFRNLSWNGNALNFTVTAATGSHGLEVMVPAMSAMGSLNGITLNGTPATYVLQAIKGIQYGVFPTTGGTYQASYGSSYSITGTVSGIGGVGATVTLSGSNVATTMTTADGSGNFTFSGLASGGYTVVPTKACCTYTPASQLVTVNTTNVLGVNFSTATVSYTLSGTVTGAGGNSATVTLSGAGTGTATADGSGNYTFTGLKNGTYTVTPSNAGYQFTPASKNATVSNANLTGVNFTTVTYSIAGTISGTGGKTATVTLSGAATATVTTNVSGNYTIPGLLNGVYTLTPSKAGYTFSPTSQGATINGANVTGLNFSASSATYSISGTITGAGGNGATVKLSGAGTESTTVDGSGNYTVAGLTNGTYTVTPTNPGYTFSPVNRSKTVSNANSTGVNFSAVGAPAVLLSPTSWNFGNQQVGIASSVQTVTLTNTGTATLTITSITFTGTNPTNFAQTSNCGTSLNPGASCAINMTFEPSATGAKSAKLSIADNAPKTPQTVAVSGTGITLPVAQLSTAGFTFGTVADFAVSAPQSVTLKNPGTSALQINSIAIGGTNPGDFVVSSSACGAALAGAGSCIVKVEFTPKVEGSRSATLIFTDSAAGSPQSVSLTGTGTLVKVSPVTLTYAGLAVGGTSAAKTVTITNVGPDTLSFSGITLAGSNPGDFTETTTCGPPLTMNGICTVAVKFVPSATGSRTATLSIGDSDPTSPQLVTLTGTGQ